MSALPHEIMAQRVSANQNIFSPFNEKLRARYVITVQRKKQLQRHFLVMFQILSIISILKVSPAQYKTLPFLPFVISALCNFSP
jgi:hypothetical protein